ncbi:MAG: M23 family metallopeptidase [Salinivirgaceae bacterium]|nr:M23 family metallopeptidase [Salinivirgaceae bacterium]
MAEPKYSFDSEKLSYEKITPSFRQRASKILRNALMFCAIVLGVFVLLSVLFDTPDEKIQKRENKQLQYQYEMLTQKVGKMEENMDEIQQHDDNIHRLIFGTEKAAAGQNQDSARQLSLIGKSNSDIIQETSGTIDNLMDRIASQKELLDNLMKLVQDKEKQLASIPSISPIGEKNSKYLASGYGYHMHPIYRTLKMHSGIDLTAPRGSLVYSTGNGQVVTAGSSPDYGYHVIIDHGYGLKTLYAHLDKISVKRGQRLQRGDAVGEVGSTGRSSAPHLHYEVRKNNKTENPVNYYFSDLTPEEYKRILDESNTMTMSFD